MSKPYLVPFEPEHLIKIAARDPGIKTWEAAIRKYESGTAYTAFIDDRILGCAGVTIAWPGFGVAWMAVTDEVNRYPLYLTRMVRLVFRDIIRFHNLTRVETVVIKDNKVNRSWIERIGFSRENGCARNYLRNGLDVVRYEMVI